MKNLLKKPMFLRAALGLVLLCLWAASTNAADGHKMLDKKGEWTGTWTTLGLACEGGRCDDGVTAAKDIPAGFKQNHKGWLNSADADMVESKLFEPGHGLSVVRGQVMDGQDEGTTLVEVFDYAGNEIFSKMYGYKGDKANGGMKKWSVRAEDFGLTGWRGVTIRYTMTDEGGGPNRKPNKNGISFVHTYRADPSCQPLQNTGRSAHKGNGKGRTTISTAPQPNRNATQRDNRSRDRRN